MFFKLVGANSRRNKKDNALYFSSMLISVIAFYIILSVSNQDVMIFLSKMESDAVQRLLSIIPVLYITTLIILFVLVYFSSSIKIDRKSRLINSDNMMATGRPIASANKSLRISSR